MTVISPGYIQTNLSLNAVTADGSRYGGEIWFCVLYLTHFYLTELLQKMLATYGLWRRHKLALKYQKKPLDLAFLISNHLGVSEFLRYFIGQINLSIVFEGLCLKLEISVHLESTVRKRRAYWSIRLQALIVRWGTRLVYCSLGVGRRIYTGL